MYPLEVVTIFLATHSSSHTNYKQSTNIYTTGVKEYIQFGSAVKLHELPRLRVESNYDIYDVRGKTQRPDAHTPQWLAARLELVSVHVRMPIHCLHRHSPARGQWRRDAQIRPTAVRLDNDPGSRRGRRPDNAYVHTRHTALAYV